MPIVDISGVSDDVTNIVTFMDGVLERIVATFQSYSIPLPTRRYWTVGQSVVDCEQLVVTLMQVYLGPPGDQASTPHRCNMPRTAVMSVTIAREFPIAQANGRPPTPDKIQEASQISAIDAYALMGSINLLDVWEPGGYGTGVIATAEMVPPEGGFQMVSMQLTMAIP
jgi:hypothetical protein